MWKLIKNLLTNYMSIERQVALSNFLKIPKTERNIHVVYRIEGPDKKGIYRTKIAKATQEFALRKRRYINTEGNMFLPNEDPWITIGIRKNFLHCSRLSKQRQLSGLEYFKNRINYFGSESESTKTQANRKRQVKTLKTARRKLTLHIAKLRYKFGVKSGEQLLEWFSTRTIKSAINEGCKVMKFYVNDIVYGANQVCYREYDILKKVDITKNVEALYTLNHKRSELRKKLERLMS